MQRVSLIGLGAMGSALARTLIELSTGNAAEAETVARHLCGRAG